MIGFSRLILIASRPPLLPRAAHEAPQIACQTFRLRAPAHTSDRNRRAADRVARRTAGSDTTGLPILFCLRFLTTEISVTQRKLPVTARGAHHYVTASITREDYATVKLLAVQTLGIPRDLEG